MRKCLPGLLAATMMAIATSSAAAADGVPNTDKQPPNQPDERLLASLKLTKAQNKPVREALAAFRRDAAAWLQQNAPEIERLRKQMGKYHTARDAKTLAEVKAAMANLAKLNAQRATIKQTLMARLKELLDEKQLAMAEAALNPRRRPQGAINRFHYLGQLGLTKDQLARIGKVMEEARKGAADAADTRKVDPMQQAWATIVRDVLTDEDRQKLVNLMRKAAHRRMVMAMFRNVPLTGEQAAKIDAIWDQAYEQAKKNPSAMYEIYGQARRKAIEEVLTPEQRSQLPGEAAHKTPLFHSMPPHPAQGGEKGKMSPGG